MSLETRISVTKTYTQTGTPTWRGCVDVFRGCEKLWTQHTGIQRLNQDDALLDAEELGESISEDVYRVSAA